MQLHFCHASAWVLLHAAGELSGPVVVGIMACLFKAPSFSAYRDPRAVWLLPSHIITLSHIAFLNDCNLLHSLER